MSPRAEPTRFLDIGQHIALGIAEPGRAGTQVDRDAQAGTGVADRIDAGAAVETIGAQATVEDVVPGICPRPLAPTSPVRTSSWVLPTTLSTPDSVSPAAEALAPVPGLQIDPHPAVLSP